VLYFPFTGTHNGLRNREDFRLYPRPDAEQVPLPVDLEWLLIVAVHQPYVILYHFTVWLLEKACFSSLFYRRAQHVGQLSPPHVHCHRCLQCLISVHDIQSAGVAVMGADHTQ